MADGSQGIGADWRQRKVAPLLSAEIGDSGIVEPNRVAHTEYFLSDWAVDDVLAAESFADEVALSDGSVRSVSDHERRAGLELPEVEANGFSILGRRGIAPWSDDEVDDCGIVVVTWSPLHVVDADGGFAFLDVAPDTPGHVAAA